MPPISFPPSGFASKRRWPEWIRLKSSVQQGKLEEALAEFQKAYAIDPSSAIAEQELKRTKEMIEREKNPQGRASTPEERGLTPAEKAQKEIDEKVSANDAGA